MKTPLAVFLLLIFTAFVIAGDYVVIVNKDNSVASISVADLKRIYIGKKNDINGIKVVPINQSLESPTAQSFLKTIVGQSPDEYKEFWLAEQVKGGASAPMVQKTAEGVVAMVSQIPGAIGYVEKSKVTADIKEIPVK